MDWDPLRIAEHVHGHVGWLAAISLVHPAIVLRRKTRKAHLAVGLATALATAAATMGAAMYPSYREQLRQAIFIHAPSVGYMFERKEHLAFGAVLFAWAGAIAYAAAWRVDGELRLRLRTAAHVAYVASAALAVATAALGTAVGSYKSF